MPKPGLRTTYKYTDQFKATAVRLSPGVDRPISHLTYDCLGHAAEVQGLYSQAAALRLEPAAQIRIFDLPE